jgi:glutathione S-transferase
MTKASPLQGLPDVALRLTAVVTLLALLVYVYIGLTVSAMRDKYGVAPPAVTGPAEFERAFRAHQNTLESLPVFLATLWIASVYFRPYPCLPAAVALLWIAGRFLYVRGYIIAPEKRRLGLQLGTLAMGVNLALAVAGVLSF